jgi:hypothetical protein
MRRNERVLTVAVTQFVTHEQLDVGRIEPLNSGFG